MTLDLYVFCVAAALNNESCGLLFERGQFDRRTNFAHSEREYSAMIDTDNVSNFSPLLRAWNRVEIELQDSEVAAFHSLLYLGEFIVKLVSAAFASGAQADPDRRGYAIEYRLVRASGVGEHVSVLDEILVGPTYEVLHPGIRLLQKQLVTKNSPGSEELECLSAMIEAMTSLGLEIGSQAPVNSLRAWFHWFVQIRNKTRGHGAPQSEKLAAAYKPLRKSMRFLIDRVEILNLPWAFVRRNLSGKYRVVPIGGDPTVLALDELRSGIRKVEGDGIYLVCSDYLSHVRLVLSDADLSDFYVPNGSYQNSRCEFISLVSGNVIEFDASTYDAPTSNLPPSETDGLKELTVVGQCFTNMPARPDSYIERAILEKELLKILLQGRHEIASLSGPGGAGKTSLALQVCHALARSGSDRFAQIIWFSSRDIDLLPSGPKTVKPQGLSLRDFSKSYVEMTGPKDASQKGFKPDEYFAAELGEPAVGPILFVFDNFETVGSQAELFSWIDAHIRSPNKALITTRAREFSGDKSIIVQGMEDNESRKLISNTAERLGISNLLDSSRVDELVRESGGHPYVLKILLGEIASRGSYVSPERVIAEEGRLLVALFERTYSRLSPAAQLAFLLLSSWKSAIPAFAIDATLLFHVQERMQVSEAADELVRLSMVEEIASAGGVAYLNVPLAASAFGKKKLLTSSYRALVEQCLETLKLFGATQSSGANRSAQEVSQRFIRAIQKKIESCQVTLEDVRPLLEGLAGETPSVWGLLENLVNQVSPENFALRSEYLKRFIESSPPNRIVVEAWRALAQMLSITGDSEGEILAYGEIALLPDASVRDVSDAANRLNNAIKANPQDVGRLSSDAKRATIEKVIRRLMDHYELLSATDLSRLAWLYLNLGNESEARRVAEEGIKRQSGNDYCLRLLERLAN